MRIIFLVSLLLVSFFASSQNVGTLPNSILPLDTASYTLLAQPSATTLRKASLNRIFLTGKNYYDGLYRPISYVPTWASITGKPNLIELPSTPGSGQNRHSVRWNNGTSSWNYFSLDDYLWTGDSTNISMKFGEDWGEVWSLKAWKSDVSYGSNLLIGYDFVDFYNQSSPADPVGASTNGFTVGNGVGFYSSDFNTFGSRVYFKDSIKLTSFRRIQFYKQNEEDPFSETDPTLVADFGNDIRLPTIAANPTETWSLVIDEDGIVTSQPSSSGATNLAFTPSPTNGIVTSDTGTDATIPLGNGTNSGLSLNDYTTAEKSKLAGIEANANNYVHPNHTGDVTSVGDGSTTIANDAVTNAKAANMAVNTIKGRITAGTGDPEDLTAAQVRTITETETTTQLNTRDTNNRSRTNHTGTQPASTISDFDAAVEANLNLLFKTVTAGTYTILEGDKKYQITFTNPCTITLPDGLSTGHWFTVWNTSGGTLTFTATTTLNTQGGATTIAEDYQGAYFQHIGSNVWEGVGLGSGGGGGVTDGDKGDITVSGSGATWVIDAQSVSYSKIQNVSPGVILGNSSVSTASIEQISVGPALTLQSGVLDAIVPLINSGDGNSVLRNDGTYGAVPVTRKNALTVEADFYTDTSPYSPSFVGAAISGGTDNVIAGEANHPGIIDLRDGTTANGGWNISTASTAFLLAGGERAVVTFQIRNARATANGWIGFKDNTTNAQPVDGAYVYFVGNGTTVTMDARTRSNSTETINGTTWVPTLNTWYTLVIEVNAGATQVNYEVFDDAGVSQWAVNNTTNIPTGAGRQTGFGIQANESTTDAATAIMYVDYARMEINRTLTR